VRERDADRCRDREGRADPRHDLHLDPRLTESLELLAAPAEHERIATLEPDDIPAGQRPFDHEPFDLGLLHRVVIAELSAIDLFGRIGE